MKSITILSGKGGVGKSSIAASMAVLLSRKKNIVAVDCDVDASNLALVFGIGKFEKESFISTNYKAFLDREKCNSCRKCLDVCTFSAIEWDKGKNIPVINGFLCEGCGSCRLVCPQNAIELRRVKNAVIGRADTGYGFPLVSGQLKMGASGSGKVVSEVKIEAEKMGGDVMVIDAAAGIGCPVIASVLGSDYVIAVTEPSPAALSDMKRALEVVNHFGIPHGIVINKFDLNKPFSGKIIEFAMENNIPVLGKIPYSRKFVEAMVSMKPVVIYDRGFEKIFYEIAKKIEYVWV